jgi:hypothetical protein
MAEAAADGAPPARPLPPDMAAVLQELAKGVLTLEHAISFYPAGHQSRRAPLERLHALLREEAAVSGEASLAIAGDAVAWRGEIFSELPSAARKLAALFADQGIARLSWSPGIRADELERFVGLLARGRGAHRQSWDPAASFEHLRVEGLDYQALMELDAGDAPGPGAESRALWLTLLPRALREAAPAFSDEELKALREGWADPAALAALLVDAIGPGARTGDPEAVEQVRRFARQAGRAAASGDPLPEGECERNLGALARQLPPALRLRLFEATLDSDADDVTPAGLGDLDADESVALIAGNFSLDPGQIGRLARVFQHLVPRGLERLELAPRIREGLRGADDPGEPLADNIWEEVEGLLTGESGEFMSPGYQEQLRRLADRREARRRGEDALARQPELAADLASTRVAEESLRIHFEQLHLATSLERFRDALEALGGLCSATLAAGDRERGLWILEELLRINAGEEALAGPRAELGRALQAVAAPPVLQAMLGFPDGLGAGERAVLGGLFALVPDAAAPALLDALADDGGPERRREVEGLLRGLGRAALPEVLLRLPEAPAAQARVLLSLVAEQRDPAAVPVLLGLLGRDDVKLRRDALRALLAIDSPEVRRALPALLEDQDAEIIHLAAAHLGTVGSPETLRALLRRLETGFFAGRRSEEMLRAILVLGRMRAVEAVEPLAGLLRRRTWVNRAVREHVGSAAAQALARIGGEAAKKALEQAAARGSGAASETCRRLLARWGAP